MWAQAFEGVQSLQVRVPGLDGIGEDQSWIYHVRRSNRRKHEATYGLGSIVGGSNVA